MSLLHGTVKQRVHIGKGYSPFGLIGEISLIKLKLLKRVHFENNLSLGWIKKVFFVTYTPLIDSKAYQTNKLF
jgi:hypothetical protein